MSAITVQSIKSEDALDVVEFMKADFLKIEPICEPLGGLSDSLVLQRRIQRMVESGLSFEAIDESADNERVGVILCQMHMKGAKNQIEEELEGMEMDEKTEKISNLLNEIYPSVLSEIYNHRQKSAYFEGVYLSVRSDYGGRGIAGKLIAAMEMKARDLDVETIYICCSSEFSRRACEKLDYVLFHSFPYTNHVRNGEVVFNVKPPHYALKSYIKILK